MGGVSNTDTVVSVRPVKRENLPAGIAAELRGKILRGELQPGARLPGHRELAAMYAVSVGSIREAISMLISAHLVETRAGRGTFVVDGDSAPHAELPGPPLSRQQVEELVEARELIESELAELAAKRASSEQIAALEGAVERMEAAAGNPLDYPDADVEFHLLLAEAAGNRYLLRAMNDIRVLLKQDMELGAEAAIRRFGDLHISVEDHRRLVEAVAGRDPERARTTLAGIVRRNRDFVLGLYAMAPVGP